MNNQEKLKNEFERIIGKLAKSLNLTNCDEAELANIALLQSNAFLRARSPYIAVTGITHTGKSSLINAIFGEKKSEEGLIADTTSVVVKIKFKSGMEIYDTPGAGGAEVEWENITRAYLGLKHLDKDLDGNPLAPVSEIPTIDADNYDPKTDSPKALKKYEEFEKPDVFLFVVDIKAGTLKREDILFFRDVATLGKPVIVVVNKIDEADRNTVQASLDHIKKKLSRQAVPVSAKTGMNIKQLLTSIIMHLPRECGQVLGDTVNREYEKLVRHQQIIAHSVATAVKTARLVGGKGQTEQLYQILANVLGLYLWIVDQYSLSGGQLQRAGISLDDLSQIGNSKLNSAEILKASRSQGALILGSSLVGLTLGSLASGGLLVPIGVGAFSGCYLPSAIIILRELFKRLPIEKMKREAEAIKPFITIANRYETAASVLAFGQSVRKCCDILREPDSANVDFLQIFQQEYERALEELKPFSKELNTNSGDEEDLIREIFANIL
jgi:ribosome biogenesis GTPase A